MLISGIPATLHNPDLADHLGQNRGAVSGGMKEGVLSSQPVSGEGAGEAGRKASKGIDTSTGNL